jgi:adenylosuccinate lyase
MSATALTALSPLDGRYANACAPLRPWMSEFGLMRERVRVEVEWLIALSDAGLPELTRFSDAARAVLRGLVTDFSTEDAQAIKDIERTTNHDVKAVEYWLKSRFEGQPRSSCTSPAPAKTSTTSAMR